MDAKKRQKCPDGTRKNKNGDCVEYKKNEGTPVKKRCPKGTRKNKKGDCVPIGTGANFLPDQPSNGDSSIDVVGLKQPSDSANRTLLPTKKTIVIPKSTFMVENPKDVVEESKDIIVGDNGPVQVRDKLLPVEQNKPLQVEDKPLQVEDKPLQVEDKPLQVEDKPLQVEDKPLIKKTKKSDSMNDFLMQKELADFKSSRDPTFDFLYPDLNDPLFNQKIASKKEFADTKYDGKPRDIEKYADIMCNAKFELSPHQLFVKNFMSTNTPYRSLLLFHGLGTGKTCSAIGIAEETRSYLKQIGMKEKIIVVASPNVQGNFRLQLFDDRKLTKITNIANPNEFTWNIEACVGNELLREINPNSIRNLTKEKVISNINTLINDNYIFMGYIQLANYINKVIGEKNTKETEILNIEKAFNNRLIIIDEVHNIRLADDNKNKAVAALLMKVAKYSKSMRLLLLSATPMYNSYREIVWLTNLMNLNDGRSMIDVNDIFDADGEFKQSTKTGETGEDLLIRKLTGYVSYVRGENPYLFPARIYPKDFAGEENRIHEYPAKQLNNMTIDTPLKHVDVYSNQMVSTYQSKVYQHVIRNLGELVFSKMGKMVDWEEMESFGYTMLHLPLEILNITYPSDDMTQMLLESEDSFDEEVINQVVGSSGLSRTMVFEETYTPDPLKSSFDYKPAVLKKYGRIFAPDQIQKYSTKIAEICSIIRKSEGVVLVYSQYIDGGLVPLALALEEMGFTKYSDAAYSKSLFKKPPTDLCDALTMKPRGEVDPVAFQPAKYIMITGDKMFSPSNTADVKYATNKENKDGSKVKVILISKTGSEGLDFKFIRQIHILEPWYNMNRIEQIIGRGVRNLSHCALEFKKRNCQIFMHTTLIPDSDQEPVDLYVYRLAEKKALKIGKITRLLKEVAVDCILNIEQTQFTNKDLMEIAENENIVMRLSSDSREIKLALGDQPFTNICDYMDTCEHKCRSKPADNSKHNLYTYSAFHAESNQNYISQRIRQLYRENHFYTRSQIVAAINMNRVYPLEQIYFILSKFFENNKSEYLIDKYGRFGYLINRKNYYVFHPIEITDESISLYETMTPVEYKRSHISLELPKEIRIKDRSDVKEAVDKIESSDEYTSIIDEIEANWKLCQDVQVTSSGEKNWYKRFSQIKEHLEIVYSIDDNVLTKYIVEHNLDTLEFIKKMALLKEVSRKGFVPLRAIEKHVRDYFTGKLMYNREKGKMGIVLVDVAETKLMVKSIDGSDEWAEGDTIDIGILSTDSARVLGIDKTKLNKMIGYIVEFKDKEMVFKFRDITSSVNRKGQKCDSAGKLLMIKVLNGVIGSEKYDDRNIAFIHSISVCVLMEVLMREYTRVRKDGKIYFLTPEQTILSKIMAYTANA